MGSTVQKFRPGAPGDNWDGTDPAGGDVRKLPQDAGDIVSGNVATIAGFGTSGLKDIMLRPFATNTTAGINSLYGWAINLDGADGMEATATAHRRIPSGSWTFEGRVSAAPVAALNECFLKVNLYKISRDGTTRTQQGGTGQQRFAALATAGVDVLITLAGVPEIIFAPDESLLVAFYVTGTGQLGGLQVDFRIDSGLTGSDTVVTLPSPGLRTRYLPPLADTAGAADALTRIVRFPRALADTAPAADALTRRLSTFRALADTAPASDALTRVVHFPRVLADTAGAADTLGRLVQFIRALGESAPASDALSRRIAALRALADTAPAADGLTRRLVLGRAMADSAPASDGLGRVVKFNRALAETAGASDALGRRVAVGRLLADTAGAADGLGRVVNYKRPLDENIGPSGSGEPTIYGITLGKIRRRTGDEVQKELRQINKTQD